MNLNFGRFGVDSIMKIIMNIAIIIIIGDKMKLP